MSAVRRIVAAGVLLALSGCSGPDPDVTPPPPSSAVSAPPTSASSPSADATAPGPAVTGIQYSAAQLEAALIAVDEAEVLNASVVPDSEIRARLESGSGQGGIQVTPEACNVYAESSPQALAAEATLAAMTFAGESSLQPDSITLSSLPEEQAALRQLEEARAQLNACSEFTFQAGGQEVEAAVEELDVETEAADHLALRTTVQIPGTIQESVTITGVVRSTVISVLVGSSNDAEADSARAVELLNLVAAELAKL